MSSPGTDNFALKLICTWRTHGPARFMVSQGPAPYSMTESWYKFLPLCFCHMYICILYTYIHVYIYVYIYICLEHSTFLLSMSSEWAHLSRPVPVASSFWSFSYAPNAHSCLPISGSTALYVCFYFSTKGPEMFSVVYLYLPTLVVCSIVNSLKQWTRLGLGWAVDRGYIQVKYRPRYFSYSVPFNPHKEAIKIMSPK